MSALNLVQQTQQILTSIDWQITECFSRGIDFSSLVTAKEILIQHIHILQHSLAYQIDAYSSYGIAPDPMVLDDLLEEVGYEQAQELYGEDLDELLLSYQGKY